MPRPALLCAGRRSPRKGAALRGGESGAADQPPSLLGFRTHVLLWLHPTQQPAKLRRHRGGEEQGRPGAAGGSREAGPAAPPGGLLCRGPPAFATEESSGQHSRGGPPADVTRFHPTGILIYGCQAPEALPVPVPPGPCLGRSSTERQPAPDS